ncbi:substrate-binding domain-containing protein [Streptomyces sp. NPDC047002]|uniref:substrate-binding domain-containing protein n=1 Tax=Streptomyces sp. NPDC047002 TaxID=3155475 RepID=UPI003453D3E3
MKTRILGIVLAVVLTGGVASLVVTRLSADGTGPATKTAVQVHGVIGSEKADFFADPAVRKALAAEGFTVKAVTSGSWAMQDQPLKGEDFAFPSSQAPADALAAQLHVTRELPRPFYSPLVVVATRAAAQVLADNGLASLDAAHRGTLRMAAYLKAADRDTTWQDLKGAAAHAELRGTLTITSTDPETSNSGALLLADAGYVANGDSVVTDQAGLDRTAPLLKKLVAAQGAQKSSSEEPFTDFISGVGTPLVLAYESQVAALLLAHQDPGDLVTLYPDTTVSSDHTVVPLTPAGRRFSELLTSDPELQRLEVAHGFRPRAARAAFDTATAGDDAYLNRPLRGIVLAPVPTSDIIRRMAREARS